MNECPCGHPLEIKTVTNLSFHCEAEVITCLCGRMRESYEPDKRRAAFIKITFDMMNVKVPNSCKSNEIYINKFKLLADSL